MKKIFTLLLALVATFGVASAETYKWYVDNTTQKQIAPDGKEKLFTIAGSVNTRYKSSTYTDADGLSFTTGTGLKFDSSGKVTFTTTKPSTVVYVQSTTANADKTIKFDGTNYAITEGQENPSEGDANVRVFIHENVGVGEHTLSKGSGETGLVYVSVTYPESSLQALTAPKIEVNAATGEVVLSSEENAPIYYTIDGSVPTEGSTLYEAPFMVEDNTIVKAIAVGDNTTTENSDVASVTVYISTGVVEAPVFAQFNGTFAITCATVNSAIEYSLDGANYLPYTIPVTVAETTTVYARATREGWTAGETSEEVTALPVLAFNKTIYIGSGSFGDPVAATDDRGGILVAKEDDDAYGFSLEILTAKKGWTKGSKKIKIAEGVERTEMYGSNGAEVMMTVPENYKVNRITFYSYVPTLARPSAWNNVNGESNNSVNLVPMASLDPSKPDVRVFNIEQEGNTITFNNTGERPNFVMAVDVIDLTDPAEVEEPMANKNADGAVESLTFEVPAYLNLYYRYVVTTPASMGETNAPMREAAETLEHEGQTFTLLHGDTLPVEQDGTIYYFAQNPVTDARSAVKSTAVSGTTSLVEISAEAGVVEYYNLQGIRVANPAEGVYIRKQGDNVSKVYVK